MKSTSRPRPVPPPAWDERPCPELGVDVFFRGDDEPAREWARRESAAMRVCRDCPVRAWCLAEALTLGDIEGVRGGLPGEMRARLLEVVDVALVSPVDGREAA